MLINAEGSLGGGAAVGRRAGRLPAPRTCPPPPLHYLLKKKKLIVCNAFFFFRRTHNTCLRLLPLVRKLSFGSEGNSLQRELRRLGGRQACGSRPAGGWEPPGGATESWEVSPLPAHFPRHYIVRIIIGARRLSQSSGFLRGRRALRSFATGISAIT